MTENTVPFYCANHSNVETILRCNKCEKPICLKCAIRTPTGYRCKDCVRGQQKVFDNAQWIDYLLGFITASLLSFLASLLTGLIGALTGFFAWLILIATAPTLGIIICEAVRFVTHRHRARALFITAAAGVVIGAFPAILFNIISLNIFGLIFQVIYLMIASPVVYTRLSGIRFSR